MDKKSEKTKKITVEELINEWKIQNEKNERECDYNDMVYVKAEAKNHFINSHIHEDMHYPFLTKLAIVRDLIDSCFHATIGEGEDAKKIFYQNNVSLRINWQMMMVALYTDIKFDRDWKSIVSAYDLLDSTFGMDYIVTEIEYLNQNECRTLNKMKKDVVKDILENEHSVPAIIENKLRAFDIIIDEFKKAFNNVDWASIIEKKLDEME